MSTKTTEVRARFESPQWYLRRRRYNIEVRRETVREFARRLNPARVLDIGCGDGSISLPLLTATNRLTLVDLSGGMLEVAKSRIPAVATERVGVVNGDFLAADLAPQSFDLIICLGLLAHVDSPAEVIAKITNLLSGDGAVIIESTDAGHFLARRKKLFGQVLQIARRVPYPLTRTTSDEIARMFRDRGFELSAIFRYSLPANTLALDRIIPQRVLHWLIKLIFGSAKHGRNARFGTECIYLFKACRVAESHAVLDEVKTGPCSTGEKKIESNTKMENPTEDILVVQMKREPATYLKYFGFRNRVKRGAVSPGAGANREL